MTEIRLVNKNWNSLYPYIYIKIGREKYSLLIPFW
jgi:hypothetical protein